MTMPRHTQENVSDAPFIRYSLTRAVQRALSAAGVKDASGQQTSSGTASRRAFRIESIE